MQTSIRVEISNLNTMNIVFNAIKKDISGRTCVFVVKLIYQRITVTVFDLCNRLSENSFQYLLL